LHLVVFLGREARRGARPSNLLSQTSVAPRTELMRSMHRTSARRAANLNKKRSRNQGRRAGPVFERGPRPARLGLLLFDMCREPVPLKSAVLLLRRRTAGARAAAICEVLQTRRRNPNLIELVAKIIHGTRTRVFRIWLAICADSAPNLGPQYGTAFFKQWQRFYKKLHQKWCRFLAPNLGPFSGPRIKRIRKR